MPAGPVPWPVTARGRGCPPQPACGAAREWRPAARIRFAGEAAELRVPREA